MKKINATGNPGCTLFNSECTISAGNTLRIGAGLSIYGLTAYGWEMSTPPTHFTFVELRSRLDVTGMR